MILKNPDLGMHLIIAHLSSSSDGRIHDLEMSKIIQILGKLQKFNFSPIFICADGETGLSKYHAEYFNKYIEPYIDKILDPNDEMTIIDLIHLIFSNFPHCPPLPILDILHACKSSRTRLINGNIFLNKFIPPILQEEIQMILELGSTITDMTSIGKMKDFYAINLFTFENVFKSFESENHGLTLYILIYTLVLESFRNPKINIQTRIDFCEASILFFFRFYKQINKISKKNKTEQFKTQIQEPHITQNNTKNSDGVIFASEKYLIKIIHSLLALRFVLDHHLLFLGIDRVTSHVVENFFGQNRFRCHGNNHYDHVMHFFVEGAFDFFLVQEYNLGDKINQRDNAGGTRFDAKKWTIGFDCEFNTFEFVDIMFKYGTFENDEFQESINEKADEYMLLFVDLYEKLKESNAYKSNINEPSQLSGQSIFNRYCSKS